MSEQADDGMAACRGCGKWIQFTDYIGKWVCEKCAKATASRKDDEQ